MENPEDIETLNRLAFAYTILGKVKEAKQTYQKVLHLDTQNPIALKNLKRMSTTGKSAENAGLTFTGDVDTMFLEENGKTKVVELINVAQSKIIVQLMTGEMLTLQIKRLKIFVLDGKKRYVGMLPEDIGRRLIKFLNGGNLYQACIKSVANRKIAIFIRETKRSSKFKNQPSFTSLEKAKSFSGKRFVARDTEESDSEE